ncbi:MAG TPA: hypothetical protein PKD09_09340 [Aggregatilinea sp.]|uniref:hypothetical protein n=1 Tax=Aggregatilinea sp. TaxID=2806333 RepID=UPI002D06F7CD|nr:hypothetical protein [Aggregatilinea sp.]HML21840.1 hypothetical protein [Aggregatilinea sp.]
METAELPGLKRRVPTPPKVAATARSCKGLRLVWSGTVRDETTFHLTTSLRYEIDEVSTEAINRLLAQLQQIPYYRTLKIDSQRSGKSIFIEMVTVARKQEVQS